MTTKSLSHLKKITTLLLTIFLVNSLQAQIAKTELRVNDDYLFDIKVELNDGRYTISLDTSGATAANSIIVTNFTNAVLKSFVISTMNKKAKSTNTTFKVSDTLNRRIDTRYIELIAALSNVEQEGQPIAKITLYPECNVHNVEKMEYPEGTKRKNKELEVDTNAFKIESAQLVFEDGFIKSIIVQGTYNSVDYSFSNIYPIGITTRKNILILTEQYLFSEKNFEKFKLRLSEVISYDRILGLKTNDYSPADIVVYITPNLKTEIKLRKTPSPEIFTLNIFSDFVGINANNPNGLIQTEFSKRININTRRFKFGKNWGGIGFFTHLIPFFEISKIEENNRFMPFLNQSADIANTNYANPLQVIRYSTANVRTELNFIDIQSAAVTFHVNLLAGVAITHVKDSALIDSKPTFIDETINTFAYGSNMKFIFNPESKWSYTMTGTYLRVNNLNDKFIYRTIKNGELTNSSKNLWSGELLVAWNTSEDNKLFGRFRYNWEGNNVFNNYSEFQIGFSKKFKSSKIN